MFKIKTIKKLKLEGNYHIAWLKYDELRYVKQH